MPHTIADHAVPMFYVDLLDAFAPALHHSGWACIATDVSEVMGVVTRLSVYRTKTTSGNTVRVTIGQSGNVAAAVTSSSVVGAN